MAQTEPSGTETPSESAQRKITVAVVDDHESVRLGLKAAFIDEGYDFVLAAATVKELVEGLNGREVDVVVLDLSLGDGSTVTDNVKNVQATGSAVLVHSIADRVASVREALAAGAAGVIPKSSATKTVLAAAATVARGEVLNNLEWATAIDADRDFSKAQLGRREREILHLYASGLPLKLAAQQLGIGYSTAREYLDRIRVKYVEVGRPAPTKVDLLRRAVEDGILPGLDSEGGDGH
ncbi:response regulator transcription factor [Salinibacterium sp. NSLL150]|uniref:response regulator transcription factor n=1 Tax=unclassified Salinibacterium TaxID=2632331 RepID=UPI0018CEC00E|nr:MULTISPECIES: response regulator [unclassified Salinibacterium]MBH0098490.1 response regulator transcription factor [Salinibacterium sp. NSLL35]MBH0101245.1 response regulator transcription factor [Salinibacterium sp. NSLL150]MBH0104004.1 response regulator transcription factor [Salinibacterium sp. NSLL16]MBH0106765.1 response regulator transcription factor [Salinibacterium sp. NSLL17]MBH0109463.1 response regulator transcription factor [Salinibacterium sp. NG22]